ncbi:D-alanyl-D-alanine carboxypeptidase family protein [Bacillus testis]|uniref:D-alanyl-D-alanine carboxypeptidase family protein n=1 Tax=Bacillus testis TaxID=1622072 RepID=UPI00067EDB13|nr:D-alanyl-D-alanine carboxypeptidase family protein [Bacillus testis]
MKTKVYGFFIIVLLLCMATPNIRTFMMGKWAFENDQEDIETVQTIGNNSVMKNPAAASTIDITGEAAILMEENTGKILYAKNEHKRLYPASTTKIMTALLALENGDLSEKVKVGEEVELKEKGESTAFLRKGQTMTLEQLLQGLMLPSGNDAARTISIYIARKVSGNKEMSNQKAMAYFAKLMNAKAKKVGARDTHFVNPNGLHSDGHYSTAYDLAKIAQTAMKNKDFKKIVTRDEYSDRSVTYKNTNKLLSPDSAYYYQGANGIKTGFTDQAGSCLVSSAVHEQTHLVAVVLKSTKADIWKDSVTLLDNGFSKITASR